MPTARYPHFDLANPYIRKLTEESRARIASEQDFQWWREDLALVEKNRATKSVSLNEAERRRERDEAKARTKAHKEARLSREETEPTIYEITVKNADSPGLPPALEAKKPKADAVAENSACLLYTSRCV